MQEKRIQVAPTDNKALPHEKIWFFERLLDRAKTSGNTYPDRHKEGVDARPSFAVVQCDENGRLPSTMMSQEGFFQEFGEPARNS